MDDISNLIIQIGLTLIVVFAVYYWFSVSFQYELDEAGIHIKPRFSLIRFEIAYLRFNLVKTISVMPSWKLMPLLFIPVITFATSFAQKEWIVLRYKAGAFRIVILTPKQPRQFVEAIRDKLPQGVVIKYSTPA